MILRKHCYGLVAAAGTLGFGLLGAPATAAPLNTPKPDVAGVLAKPVHWDGGYYRRYHYGYSEPRYYRRHYRPRYHYYGYGPQYYYDPGPRYYRYWW
jgi:hypothetical protein